MVQPPGRSWASGAAGIPWAFESCAGRRFKDAAEWPKYAGYGFAWDYPPIARLMNNTAAQYTVCAHSASTLENYGRRKSISNGALASK